MKTKGQIKKLNFNDYAFFKGCSTVEAKWEFAEILFPENYMETRDERGNYDTSKYLTKTGNPKISASDIVEVEKFDFTMKSYSDLDGKSQFKYLCDYYNKGLPNQKLLEYAENPTFIKALKFTGKNTIVNDIINPEQLRKLQETWLIKNCYMVKRWSDKAVEFIKSNDWAKGILTLNLFTELEIEDQMDKYEKRKNPNLIVDEIY